MSDSPVLTLGSGAVSHALGGGCEPALRMVLTGEPIAAFIGKRRPEHKGR